MQLIIRQGPRSHPSSRDKSRLTLHSGQGGNSLITHLVPFRLSVFGRQWLSSCSSLRTLCVVLSHYLVSVTHRSHGIMGASVIHEIICYSCVGVVMVTDSLVCFRFVLSLCYICALLTYCIRNHHMLDEGEGESAGMIDCDTLCV